MRKLNKKRVGIALGIVIIVILGIIFWFTNRTDEHRLESQTIEKYTNINLDSLMKSCNIDEGNYYIVESGKDIPLNNSEVTIENTTTFKKISNNSRCTLEVKVVDTNKPVIEVTYNGEKVENNSTLSITQYSTVNIRAFDKRNGEEVSVDYTITPEESSIGQEIGIQEYTIKTRLN